MTTARPHEETPKETGWRRRRRSGAAMLAALSLLTCTPFLTTCATNPATGERIFTIMSPQEEQKLGDEEHPKLVAAFGGEFKDKALDAYVNSVGQLLARTTELPNLKYTFTVLDTPDVNAFALPGGYVHVTRGLLALANNEAELAGVLGHELGHINARHTAQRYSKSVIAGIGANVLGILTGSSALTDIASRAARLALLSYSREDEFQADMLGVRYLTRAGFDPHAMASFLATLHTYSQLEAEIHGQPPGTVDQRNMLATHPRTVERVERAAAEAGNSHVRNPIVGRDVYLRKINGLIFGDSPSQGFVRGRDFLHPKLRFRFRVPEGFKLQNTPQRVVATGPDRAQIVFDSDKQKGRRRAPLDYMENVWAQGLVLSDREAITINGLRAATADARVRTNDGARDLRLVVIQGDGPEMWRFLFLTPPQDTQKLSLALRRTTYSFRRVSAAEAAKWKPWRVHLHKVVAGDTVESLAARMPFSKLKVEWFRALNGLGTGEPLRLGQTVKLVLDH